jgi:hypothetical protein
VKYDLNRPGIQWRIPYGDDPALAARGLTGTGTPGTTNSIVVTETGLVFGAGGDSQVHAWDSETGKPLWSSRFDGSFLGSLVMYETEGQQYLLVPAASRPADAAGAAPLQPPRPRAHRSAGWPTPCRPGKHGTDPTNRTTKSIVPLTILAWRVVRGQPADHAKPAPTNVHRAVLVAASKLVVTARGCPWQRLRSEPRVSSVLPRAPDPRSCTGTVNS